MQGFRSTRGCVSCRRRKKGCDFEKPVCGRCQRLRIACQYEERQFVFVTEGGVSPTRTTSPAEPDAAASAALAGHSQNSLMTTNTYILIDAGFWSIYMPDEDPRLDGSVGDVRTAPWIHTVRALAEKDSIVRTALRAIAFAGLGWMREDHSLIQHALRLYAQALRETNKLLQDPRNAQSDAVLASCRTLSLFEMFRRSPAAPTEGQSQVRDWQSHVEGTCRLIQLRGPEKHLTGHGLALYDGVRMTAIIQGVAQRRPNAFTSLEWDLYTQKNLRDELFDSMNSVPGLLHRIDHFNSQLSQIRVKQDKDQVLHQGSDLLQHGLAVCNRLRNWEFRALSICEERNLFTYTPVQDGTAFLFGNGRQLRDICMSHGFGFFYICTQYWAMCVKVFASLLPLESQLQALVQELEYDIEIPCLPKWMDPDPPATNIADVAAKFFSPDAGLWSAQSAIFPVGTAMLHFVQSGRHSSLVFKKLIDAFSDNKPGAIMRDFLHSTIGPR